MAQNKKLEGEIKEMNKQFTIKQNERLAIVALPSSAPGDGANEAVATRSTLEHEAEDQNYKNHSELQAPA